jgi:hypothetical protein
VIKKKKEKDQTTECQVHIEDMHQSVMKCHQLHRHQQQEGISVLQGNQVQQEQVGHLYDLINQ